MPSPEEPPQYTSSSTYCQYENEDFEVIKTLIEHLGIDKDWKTYIDYLLEHKEVYAINSKFSNNEGYAKSLANDSVINK